jgi:hypothetical protein
MLREELRKHLKAFASTLLLFLGDALTASSCVAVFLGGGWTIRRIGLFFDPRGTEFKELWAWLNYFDEGVLLIVLAMLAVNLLRRFFLILYPVQDQVRR